MNEPVVNHGMNLQGKIICPHIYSAWNLQLVQKNSPVSAGKGKGTLFSIFVRQASMINHAHVKMDNSIVSEIVNTGKV